MNWMESILGFGIQRSNCDASIVAKDIQRVFSGDPSLGKCLHGFKIAHIQGPPFDRRRVAVGLCDLIAHFSRSCGVLLPFRGFSTAQDNISTPCCEGLCCFEPNAVIRASDDDPFTGEIGTGNFLVSEKCSICPSDALHQVVQKVKQGCHFKRSSRSDKDDKDGEVRLFWSDTSDGRTGYRD